MAVGNNINVSRYIKYHPKIPSSTINKEIEGYSNIVKYLTIKLFMINPMKYPTKNYKELIQKHFFGKKDAILKKVDEWIKEASKTKALYTSFVRWQHP